MISYHHCAAFCRRMWPDCLRWMDVTDVHGAAAAEHGHSGSAIVRACLLLLLFCVFAGASEPLLKAVTHAEAASGLERHKGLDFAATSNQSQQGSRCEAASTQRSVGWSDKNKRKQHKRQQRIFFNSPFSISTDAHCVHYVGLCVMSQRELIAQRVILKHPITLKCVYQQS